MLAFKTHTGFQAFHTRCTETLIIYMKQSPACWFYNGSSMEAARVSFIEESGLDEKPRRKKQEGTKRPYTRYTKQQQYKFLSDAIAHPKMSLASIARKHGIHIRMAQKWMGKLINPTATPSKRRPVLPMESMLFAFPMNGDPVNQAVPDDCQYRMGLDSSELARRLEAMRISFAGHNAYTDKSVQQMTRALETMGIE
jgi:hypothetical protein